MIPSVLYRSADSNEVEGRAFETRHGFRGDFLGRFSHSKERDGLTGSYARIGSSAEFSNQTGRDQGYELEHNEMFNPLFEIFDISGGRREEFVNYIDELVENEFAYLVRRLQRAGIKVDVNIAGQFDLMWLDETNDKGFPIPVLIEASKKLAEWIPKIQISPVIGYVGEVDLNTDIGGSIKQGNNIHLQFPVEAEDVNEVKGVIERMPGQWEASLVRLTNGETFNMNYVSEIRVDGGNGGYYQNADQIGSGTAVREFLEGVDISLPITVINRTKVLVFENERGEVLGVPSVINGQKLRYRTAEGVEHAISVDDIRSRQGKLFIVDAAMLGVDDVLGVTTPGGIDLNPNNLDLNVKGDKIKMDHFNPQNLNNISVDGFIPVIINVSPISNIPLLIGDLDDPKSEIYFSALNSALDEIKCIFRSSVNSHSDLA